MKFNTKTSLILGILAVLCLVALMSFSWFWQRPPEGTVSLYVPSASSTVYIDLETTIVTTSAAERVTRTLPIGTHSLVVTKDGYYPWKKSLTVREGTETSAHVILVPEKPSLQSITPYARDAEGTLVPDPSYHDILTATQSQAKKRTITSPSGSVTLTVSSTVITAAWNVPGTPPQFFCNATGCGTTTTVFSSSLGNITSAAFYPGRNDVIAFSIGNSVFIREIDNRPVPNSYPLYKGTAPTVAAFAGALIVKDGTKLLSYVPSQ